MNNPDSCYSCEGLMPQVTRHVKLWSGVRRYVHRDDADSSDLVCCQLTEHPTRVVEPPAFFACRRDVQAQVLHRATVDREENSGRGENGIARHCIAVQRQCIHAPLQLPTREVTTFRTRDSGAGGDVALYRAQRALTLTRHGLAQATQVPVVAAGGKVLGDRQFWRQRGQSIRSTLVVSRSIWIGVPDPHCRP